MKRSTRTGIQRRSRRLDKQSEFRRDTMTAGKVGHGGRYGGGSATGIKRDKGCPLCGRKGKRANHDKCKQQLKTMNVTLT